MVSIWVLFQWLNNDIFIFMCVRMSFLYFQINCDMLIVYIIGSHKHYSN